MSSWSTASFLGRLAPEDLQALCAAATTARYRAGEVLLREGGAPTEVLLVLAGTVKVTKVSVHGREAVLELRGPGDVLGELGAVDGAPRSASAVALDAVEAAVLPTSAFDDVLRHRAGVTHALLATIVERLRRSAERQLELGTVDVVGRVCARIAELAMTQGPDPGVSQQDLADWAGVSRDGVVRALTELRARGWIETGRRRLRVLDPDAVRHRAGTSLPA